MAASFWWNASPDFGNPAKRKTNTGDLATDDWDDAANYPITLEKLKNADLIYETRYKNFYLLLWIWIWPYWTKRDCMDQHDR